ncbi:hypothetical protein H2201_003831 [Coniosporium apollinis]|uniref:BTB domain-containing protein n=1 Tax=Coniosporium apollinis TaxID=61459 RepID=A0ABQ9NUS6_9PEZI|nr:hypothetical protein H2201_003831 [Coniosporium apollinis]
MPDDLNKVVYEGESEDSSQDIRDDPSLRDLGTEVVTVRVEGTEKSFLVDKALLCFYSVYFRNTCMGAFSEADERATRVEGTSLITFRRFMKWLYTRKIIVYANPKEDRLDLAQRSLLNLYIFADRYDVRHLRNNVMRAWVSLRVQRPGRCSYEVVVKAFGNLPTNSAFCRFLVRDFGDRWVPRADDECERMLWSRLPTEFFDGGPHAPGGTTLPRLGIS